MEKNYKIYHVTRNLAKHSFELDDKLYGSPLSKEKTDWAVDDPEKYLKDLQEEYDLLENRMDDFSYVMRQKGLGSIVDTIATYIPDMDIKTADYHIYHRFTDRSFNYLEKIVYQLGSDGVDGITLNVPKAIRQLNAIHAALYDIKVSMVRFAEYAKSQNS